MESQTPELPPLPDEVVLRLRSEHGWAKETIRAIEAEVRTAIAAAVLKERADAERYRWLRQYPAHNDKLAEALDAAIDAAIRARADGGEGA